MNKKTKPIYIFSTKDPSQNKRYIQTKSKGIEKEFHANGNRKIPRVIILISDKINFKTKAICFRETKKDTT